ncbi:MAG: hypothetical protein IKE27_10055, partial [Oscillospiraceae bacterium]|nr:hypothetical protein [Oscillospiraceae bacterium]
TELAGKIINNEWEDMNITAGLSPYDKYPTESEWLAQFEGYCGMGSPMSDRYYSHLPVWTGGNIYCNGAKPRKGETDAVRVSSHVEVNLTEENGSWKLQTNLYDVLPATHCSVITTDILGKAIEPEQRFENPDGSPLEIDSDYFGAKRSEKIIPGPFASEAAEITV